jgi:hypothetical protein
MPRSIVCAAILALLSFAPVASAEEQEKPDREAVDARARYTLYPGMKATSGAPAALQGLNGDLHEADVSVGVPIVENQGKTIVRVGLGYTYTRYQLAGLQPAQQPTLDPNDTVTLSSPVPTDLHAVTASVSLWQPLGRDWAMIITLKPGIYSDMRVWDLGAVTLQGLSEVSWRISDSLSAGLGFSYTSHFGQALLLPVLQVNWNMGGGFRFAFLAPENGQLSWQPTDWLTLNLFGRVSGGAYRVHPDATLRQVDPATGQTSTQAVSFAYDLAYSTLSVGAGVRLRLARGFHVFAESPFALNRRWDASNLCWDAAGKTQCVDGPTSVSLANVNGKYSLGVNGGVELRF